MPDFDWDNIRHFLEVVKQGSATKAARALGVNQSTVSRRMTTLEEQLGAALFDRSHSNLWLITPIGERLAAVANTMRDQANEIERLAFSSTQEISGTVRLTVGDFSMREIIIGIVEGFCRDFPNIEIEFIVSDTGLDLSAREADIAVRGTDAPPPNVIGKRIGEVAYRVYGVKKYYDQFVSGDRTMPCISWLGDGTTRPAWIRRNFPDCAIVHRVNSATVGVEMAKQAMGLLQVDCMAGDVERKLYRIPVNFVEKGWGFWVLSHVDLRTTPRVRLLRDRLVRSLTEKLPLIEGRAPIRPEASQ